MRVGADTVDSWAGSVASGFSAYTRLTAPSIGPHHFGDMASLMVGQVHCPDARAGCAVRGASTTAGPDYEIPSAQSVMTLDEVYSYASMVAMFRSTWWPSGVLSEMAPDSLQLRMLTADAVIRVTMASSRTRQVLDIASKSFAGPGIIWTSDDDDGVTRYVLLANLGNATLEVGVDFAQLGIDARHSCDCTELWNSTKMARVTGPTMSASLRSHASLFVKLTNCGMDAPQMAAVKGSSVGLCTGSSAALPEAECAAWQRVFDAAGGPGWDNCASDRDDPCSCVRVRCDRLGSALRITQLRLDINSLSGTIAPEIGEFKQLTELYGYFNKQLSGTLPSTLSKLGSLKQLLLCGGQLSGTVPSAMYSLAALRQLDLSCNRLSGPLPRLPFEQYSDGCFLGGPELEQCPDGSDRGPTSRNQFACPLPPGADAAGCQASCNATGGQ